MISYFNTKLKSISIHQSGNKFFEEKFILSSEPLSIKDEKLSKLLLQYFLGPFEKINEIYRLSHPTSDLQLNEIYHFGNSIFTNPEQLHDSSIQITKHLYDVSNHPKIKSGELYVCYFTDLQIEGEVLDAIGIFKSESKEPYLKVIQKTKEFEISYEEGAINIKKLDKGCLIFNTEKEEGYKVAVIDQTNSNEAAYWIDDFLKLQIRNDNYTQTNTVLKVYKKITKMNLKQKLEIHF